MSASWSALDFSQKTRRAHALFWWAIVGPAIVIAFAFTAASSLIDARAILDDHSVTQATVTSDDGAPRRNNQLHFNYAFTVDGQTYSGRFSTSIRRADDVVGGGTVPVAYANSDPNRSQTQEQLTRNGNGRDAIIKFLTMSAIGLLLVGLVYLILSCLLNMLLPRYRDEQQ